MQLITAATVASLLVSDVLALPNPKTVQKRSLRAPATHWLSQAPVQKRGDGNVTVVNDGGGWTLSVLVGGQQMIQNIDTGSADLLVTYAQYVFFTDIATDGSLAQLYQLLNKPL